MANIRIVMFSGHRDGLCSPDHLHEVALMAPGAIWIHGGARGFDSQVAAFAKANDIPQLEFRPDYNQYPARHAPIVRNHRMLDLADMVVACYDGRSTGGTAEVVRRAKRRNLPLHILAPRAVTKDLHSMPKLPNKATDTLPPA